MIAAALQPLCSDAFEVSSGTELRFLARRSDHHFECVLCHRCSLHLPRTAACEPLCKMLSCSWWESLAQTRRVAQEAIGERRELLRARDEWQINRAIFKWQHSALSQRCRCASRRGTRAAPETPGGPPLHSFQPPASRGEGLQLGRARGRQPGNQGRREDARETPSPRQQKT